MVNVATTKLVWWILIGVAICIVVGVTSMAYVETLYMKAHVKRAEARIEKKLAELERLKQELKESK
jgi:cell division protein FtsL